MLQPSEAMKLACLAEAERRHRPIRYLGASGVRKDELARDILRENPVSEGLVCVLTCLEPCDTYRIRGNRQNKRRSFQGEVNADLRFWRRSLVGSTSPMASPTATSPLDCIRALVRTKANVPAPPLASVIDWDCCVHTA